MSTPKLIALAAASLAMLYSMRNDLAQRADAQQMLKDMESGFNAAVRKVYARPPTAVVGALSATLQRYAVIAFALFWIIAFIYRAPSILGWASAVTALVLFAASGALEMTIKWREVLLTCVKAIGGVGLATFGLAALEHARRESVLVAVNAVLVAANPLLRALIDPATTAIGAAAQFSLIFAAVVSASVVLIAVLALPFTASVMATVAATQWAVRRLERLFPTSMLAVVMGAMALIAGVVLAG